jgi:hypothetical protein
MELKEASDQNLAVKAETLKIETTRLLHETGAKKRQDSKRVMTAS